MLAIVTDLIFATKITSTAASIGTEVKIVRSIDKLDQRLNTGADRVAVIDLNAEGLDACQAIHRIKTSVNPLRIIAFASHVQTELIEAARAAGADDVMARSAFANRLPVLLAEAARLEASSTTEGDRA